MTDQLERTSTPAGEVTPQENSATHPVPVPAGEPGVPGPEAIPATGADVAAAEVSTPVDPTATNGAAQSRHARAGREGARRVHQLIQEGRLYEQEHGLKRGRQRLRQLIELGKRYEEEHGLRPASPQKNGRRLSRAGRDELLATLLDCLTRIAKPSFRAELVRLVEALTREENGRVA